VQRAQAPESAQIRVLNRVLRDAGIPQHAQGGGIRHRLRRVHQLAICLDVTGTGPLDEAT
jgi:hypothetical protein